jgi:hypothetical protein
MATAGDIIYSSLRLIGQLAEGETPSASTASDALEAMNTMIDSWSIERLSVFSTQDQVFTWAANQSTRTLGPTGDFVGNRPVLLDDSTYYVVNNLSYGLVFVNEDQYNGIALKSSTSTLPQVLWVNMKMPDIEMKIWPVPTQALAFHAVSVNVLTQPATLATTLSLPPGYLRAFKYNLACEIAAEFGIEPPPRVSRLADVSKKNIKRINNPNDVMAMPYALFARRNRFNIYTGLPQ